MVSKRVAERFWEEITIIGGFAFFVFVILAFFFVEKQLVAIDLLVGLVFIYALTVLTRIFYFKNRPEKMKHGNWLEKIDASSFPSVHAARVSFLFIYFAFSFNLETAYLFGFLLTTLMVLYSRIYLKKHYPSDVFFGVILGLLIHIFVHIL